MDNITLWVFSAATSTTYYEWIVKGFESCTGSAIVTALRLFYVLRERYASSDNHFQDLSHLASLSQRYRIVLGPKVI